MCSSNNYGLGDETTNVISDNDASVTAGCLSAYRTNRDWPTYDSTSLYDRGSLGPVEEDIRTVVSVWFEHDAHNSVTEFVCRLPLTYFEFGRHDQYSSSTQVELTGEYDRSPRVTAENTLTLVKKQTGIG